MTRSPSIALTLALIAAPAATQQAAPRGGDERTTPPGGQVSSQGGGADARSPQISRSHDALSPVTQLGPRRGGNAPAPQLTAEHGSSAGSPQLGHADRSTGGAGTLSRRSEGRVTSAAPVGGSDRCDPATARPSAGVACDRVLETRSAEFAAPPPPQLSPEQRLLMDRDRGESGGVRSAIQRVGRNDIDSDALDTQALAAIALTQPAREPVPPRPELPTEAAVNEIIQIINAAQGVVPK